MSNFFGSAGASTAYSTEGARDTDSCVFLAEDLITGTVIENHHLIALRPGIGISPMRWNDIIGKRVNKTLNKGHQLNWDDLI